MLEIIKKLFKKTYLPNSQTNFVVMLVNKTKS